MTGLDNSSGSSVETKTYDPYGNVSTSSTTSADPFGYTNSYTSASSGLVHNGLRFYDPSIQRWTQPDPISLTGSFTYVGDDPIDLIDPSGLIPQELQEPCAINGLYAAQEETACNREWNKFPRHSEGGGSETLFKTAEGTCNLLCESGFRGGGTVPEFEMTSNALSLKRA